MLIYSIDYHVHDKFLIPCTFANTGLDWQAYFGYLNTATLYGRPDYHIQDYYEVMLILRSGRKYFVRDNVFHVK